MPFEPIESLISDEHLAEAPPALPELGELDIVRHYTNLSALNMSIDSNFYPLGSCTMKYNPKCNERLAGLPGFASLHPYQDESTLQGLFQLLYELQADLAEIAGLDAVSLQPAAGAQGELTALMVAAAYFRDKGEKRTKVLVPDSTTARIRHRRIWSGSRPSRSRATVTGLSISTISTPNLTMKLLFL